MTSLIILKLNTLYGKEAYMLANLKSILPEIFIKHDQVGASKS